MMQIRTRQALDALAFPLKRSGLVASASAPYAVLFAVQSGLTASAAGGWGPGAPLAFVTILIAFAAFIPALSAWTRAELGVPAGYGWSKGETRLILVVLLVLALLFTVVGTALLMLAFMLGALAIIGAQRTGMTEAPEGFVNIFALFGTGEWIVAIVLIAAFAGFNIWLFARLALSVPATLARDQVQVLAAWPLSAGRVIQMIILTVIAAAPGLALLTAFNFASAAAFGFFPASSSSAVGPDGARALGFAAVSFVYGLLKMAALGAPLAALFARLFQVYDGETRTQPETG